MTPDYMYANQLRIFLLVLLAVFGAPACVGDAGEEAGEDVGESDDALCAAAETGEVIIELKVDAQLYTTAAHDRLLTNLPRGTKFRRVGVEEVETDAPYSHVTVRTRGKYGATGWIDTTLLRVARPVTGDCPGTASAYEANASGVERMQSQADPLSIQGTKQFAMCVSSLAGGFGDGAGSFVDGVEALSHGAFGLAHGLVMRGQLGFLYLMGMRDAGRLLQSTLVDDGEKVTAAMAIAVHALPAIHQYLSDQWLFYNTLAEAEKVQYTCRLVGRLSFEVVSAVALSELSLARSSELLKKVVAADTAVLEKVPFASRLGNSTYAVVSKSKVGHTFKDSKMPEYWARLETDMATVLHGKDRAARLRALRQLSSDINIPAKAYDGKTRVHGGLGAGNCGYVSFTMMTMLAGGSLACPLTYWNIPAAMAKMEGTAGTADALRALNAYHSTTPYLSKIDDLAARLDAALGEGQMAWLYSEASDGAHATVVLKLDGELVHLNNQGWLDRLPDGQLETLTQWDKHWRAESSSDKNILYKAVISTLRVGGGGV